MRGFKAQLPPIKEDERIYFNVPYTAKRLAQYTHCGYDPEKKLWFTGVHNANLYLLVKAYDIDKATSENARKQLAEALDEFKNIS